MPSEMRQKREKLHRTLESSMASQFGVRGAGYLESLGSTPELLRKTIITGYLSNLLGISKYFIIKREQHKHFAEYIPQSAQILLPLGIEPWS